MSDKHFQRKISASGNGEIQPQGGDPSGSFARNKRLAVGFRAGTLFDPAKKCEEIHLVTYLQYYTGTRLLSGRLGKIILNHINGEYRKKY